MGQTPSNACFLLVGDHNGYSPFLAQAGLTLPLSGLPMQTAIGNYWQRASAVVGAVSFIPGMFPDPRGGSEDGVFITRTPAQWYGGYSSPLATVMQSNARAFGGYFEPSRVEVEEWKQDDTGKGAIVGAPPSLLAKQFRTGCDDINFINFADKRGEQQGGSELDNTKFSGMVTHYSNFAAVNPDTPKGMRISGYDGKIFPPFDVSEWRKEAVTYPASLEVMVSQGYQPLTVMAINKSYEYGYKDYDVEGIPTVRYAVKATELESSESNSKRFVGAFINDDRSTTTPAAGFVDLFNLKMYHVAVSQPHFLNAAADAGDHFTVDGKPFVSASSDNADEDEKYNTLIAVDKLLGRTLEGNKRLQANWLFAPGQFGTNTATYGWMCPGCTDVGKPMPAYWADEKASIAPAQAEELTSKYNLIRMLPALSVVLIIVGILAFGLGGFCVVRLKGDGPEEPNVIFNAAQ